jgi:hypothetical protein
MKTLMSGSAMENEPEENLADSFEHWPNEPATRNDLRILATLVDRRFNKVDVQLQTMQTMIKEELFEFREAMRKEMFRFAGFLTFCGLTALGIFAAAFR